MTKNWAMWDPAVKAQIKPSLKYDERLEVFVIGVVQEPTRATEGRGTGRMVIWRILAVVEEPAHCTRRCMIA
jgi:hypothetical protein